MPNLFRNNAATTLASPVLTSDTTLVLATNTGARFPTPVIGEWFFVTVQSGVNFEIMKCTARAGDILTVERAQDGSSLQNWLAGNSVDMRIPRITLENFLQKNEVAPLAAGSAAAPSVTFGDTDTGIYGPAANELGFSANGTEVLRLSASALSYISGSNSINLTTDGAIEITRNGGGGYIDIKSAAGEDADVRIFETSNGIGFQTGGNGALATRMVINSTGQIQSVGSGTAAAPAYSFSGDTDSGIYQAVTNTISLSIGGTELMRFAGTGASLYNSDGQIQFFNAAATVRGGYIRNIVASTRFEFLADQYSMRLGTLTSSALEFVINNTVIGRFGTIGGLVLGSPTGGDLGGGVLNAVDVRVNNVSRAPQPQAAVGVGQFSHFNSGINTAAVLPSGGTWVWFLMQANSSGTLSAFGSGINAGGTTIQAAVSNVYSAGWYWRIA